MCLLCALLPQLTFPMVVMTNTTEGNFREEAFLRAHSSKYSKWKWRYGGRSGGFWSCFIFCQEAEKGGCIQLYRLLYPRLNLRRRYHPWQVGHSSSVKSFWRGTCYIIPNLTKLRLIMASTVLRCRWRILFTNQGHTVVIHFSMKLVPLAILLYG